MTCRDATLESSCSDNHGVHALSFVHLLYPRSFQSLSKVILGLMILMVTILCLSGQTRLMKLIQTPSSKLLKRNEQGIKLQQTVWSLSPQ